MAANGTGSLVFTDDVTTDKSNSMISKTFCVIVSAYIQPQTVVIPTPFTCLGVSTIKLNESLKLKHKLFDFKSIGLYLEPIILELR